MIATSFADFHDDNKNDKESFDLSTLTTAISIDSGFSNDSSSVSTVISSNSADSTFIDGSSLSNPVKTMRTTPLELIKNRKPISDDGAANRKRILVTGGTDGIGRETSLRLARLGFDVYIAGRSQQKADQLISEASKTSHVSLKFIKVDLSKIDDTKIFIDEILKIRFDYFIMNAGIMNPTESQTSDGLEMTLMTNFFSTYMIVSSIINQQTSDDKPIHFVFVTSIIVKLLSTLPSIGSRLFDPSSYESWIKASQITKTSGVTKYTISKLAHLLLPHLINQLNRADVTATAIHPGCVVTNLMKTLPARQRFYLKIFKPFLTPKNESAQNMVRATLCPLSTEFYYDTSNISKAPTMLVSPKVIQAFRTFLINYIPTFYPHNFPF